MINSNWLNLDHHEFVCIDFDDGSRLELSEGDKLLIAIDSVMVKTKEGVDYIFPVVRVQQIIKKYQDKYQPKE